MTDSKPPTSTELLNRIGKPDHPAQAILKGLHDERQLDTCNMIGLGELTVRPKNAPKLPGLRLGAQREARLHDLANELAEEARIRGETEG